MDEFCLQLATSLQRVFECTCLSWVHRLFLSEEFTKSPAFGVMMGVALLILKDRYESWRMRRNLLRALQTEVRTSKGAVAHALNGFPNDEQLDVVLQGVKEQTLTFEQLNALPAGWALFAPTLPFVDLILKLKPDEAEAAVCYVDAWARFVEFEKKASAQFNRLVDLTPKLKDAPHQIQLAEVAGQMCDSFREMRDAANHIQEQRTDLEKIVSKRLARWW